MQITPMISQNYSGCKKEEFELEQEAASNSNVEKNSGSTQQTQTSLINKCIRKRRRKTIKVHHKMPKMPEKSSKLFFDFVLHDKDKNCLPSPLTSAQYYKSIKDIKLNTDLNATQINFEAVEIDPDEGAKIYDKISKSYGTNALAVYKQLEKLHQVSEKSSDTEEQSYQARREEQSANGSSKNQLIKEAMTNSYSLVMSYDMKTLTLQAYYVSENLLKLLGFFNQTLFVQFVLKSNLPIFSVPEDYPSYICESFRQLYMEYQYQTRSSITDIYGNKYLLQEKIRSHHLQPDNLILVTHQYQPISQIQTTHNSHNYQALSQLPPEQQRAWKQFMELQSGSIKSFEERFAQCPDRALDQLQNQHYLRQIQEKTCGYRNI